MGLAMDADDAEFCRSYFARVGRDPTVTEVRVLDTYWSDHCPPYDFQHHNRRRGARGHPGARQL